MKQMVTNKDHTFACYSMLLFAIAILFPTVTSLLSAIVKYCCELLLLSTTKVTTDLATSGTY